MREQCYFCGEIDNIEKHHIIPDRFGGPDTEDNLVPLCHTCHRKIESLYDQEFWRNIGVEDITDTFASFNGNTVNGITLNELPHYGSNENWIIKYSEDTIVPFCPECQNPGRIKEVGVPKNQEKLHLRFKCQVCNVSGHKKLLHNPKISEEDLSVAEVITDWEVKDLKKDESLSKSLTLEEWHYIGNKILELRDNIAEIWKIGLPKSDTKELDKSLKWLDKSRDVLENRFYEEFPDAADTKTFYGDGRKEVTEVE